MDLASGTYPLYNLLAEVATLLEMHGVHELGLLNQVGLAEVYAETGLALGDADGVGLGRCQLGGSGEEERLADDGGVEGGDENPVAGLAGVAGLDDESAGPGERVELGGGEGDFGGREKLGRVGALDGQGGPLVGLVGESHVVGDDELVEMGEDEAAAGGLDVEEEGVRGCEDVDVGEDAAVGVQEERIAALAGGELLDMICGHGVEEALAILAAGADAAAVFELKENGH